MTPDERDKKRDEMAQRHQWTYKTDEAEIARDSFKAGFDSAVQLMLGESVTKQKQGVDLKSISAKAKK